MMYVLYNDKSPAYCNLQREYTLGDRKVNQLIGMGFTEQQARDREGRCWEGSRIHPTL